MARAADSASSRIGLSLPPLQDGEQRLYLVRHGETDWNVDGRIQGATDNILNASPGTYHASLNSGIVTVFPSGRLAYN